MAVFHSTDEHLPCAVPQQGPRGGWVCLCLPFLPSIIPQRGFSGSRLSSRLFSHVGDPFLDDPLPREYVLYLRPTGPLAQKLSDFWQQSKQICGKNKAHNIFPHITLCQFFMVSSGPCAPQPVSQWPCWPLRTWRKSGAPEDHGSQGSERVSPQLLLPLSLQRPSSTWAQWTSRRLCSSHSRDAPDPLWLVHWSAAGAATTVPSALSLSPSPLFQGKQRSQRQQGIDGRLFGSQCWPWGFPLELPGESEPICHLPLL